SPLPEDRVGRAAFGAGRVEVERRRHRRHPTASVGGSIRGHGWPRGAVSHRTLTDWRVAGRLGDTAPMIGGRRPGRRRVFTAEKVVDSLYRGLLDRPAEAAGLAFQSSRLYEGVSLAEIVHGVGHSREYFETWLRGGDLPALMEEVWRGAHQRR